MAVPTKRDKVTLVNVVKRCLLTPGKMMTNATKSVTKTRYRVRVATSAVTAVLLL